MKSYVESYLNTNIKNLICKDKRYLKTILFHFIFRCLKVSTIHLKSHELFDVSLQLLTALNQPVFPLCWWKCSSFSWIIIFLAWISLSSFTNSPSSSTSSSFTFNEMRNKTSGWVEWTLKKLKRVKTTVKETSHLRHTTVINAGESAG